MKPHKSPIGIGASYRQPGRLWSLGWHTGDDWQAPTGTKAQAMADGTVISTSYNSSYGNNVIVQTTLDSGTTHRWSVNHLSKISVKTGQKVKAGQTLGLTGSTGNVTGAHNHVETRVAPFTFSASTFRDPQVLYDWTAKIPWPIRRPAKKPAKWYRAIGLNLGGFNPTGAATFDARLPKIVAKIDRTRADVIALQELPDGKVKAATKALMGRGYNLISGSDGRYIFAQVGIETGASGVFDLRPRYQGDDKQAAWALLKIDGAWTLVVCGHLEADAGADTHRVGQAQSLIEQAEKVLSEHDLGKGRLCALVDTNSNTWVRERAFNEAKYVDAALTAWKRRKHKIATYHGWNKTKSKGPRIDAIFVHRSRPVRLYATRTSPRDLSDHHMILADLAWVSD